MSFRYRKVVPGGFFFKTYGFQRVSPDEMSDIVDRLQRQTYSREFAHNECFQPGPSPPRPPSSVCKRAKSALSEIRNPSLRPRPCSAPPEETDRMFRRIGKHTLSYRAALGKLAPSYESEIKNRPQLKPQPRDQAKSIQRIRRPTTAHKYRCGEGTRDDPRIMKYQEYDFSDDNYAPPQQVNNMVDRIRAPTIASEGGVGPMCPKRKDSIGRAAPPAKPLPLVSGLPRSKNVNEIVDRLSVCTQTHIHRRCRPISAFERNHRTAHEAPRRIKSAKPAVYHVMVPLSTQQVYYEENPTKPSPKILDTESESSTVRSDIEHYDENSYSLDKMENNRDENRETSKENVYIKEEDTVKCKENTHQFDENTDADYDNTVQHDDNAHTLDDSTYKRDDNSDKPSPKILDSESESSTDRSMSSMSSRTTYSSTTQVDRSREY